MKKQKDFFEIYQSLRRDWGNVNPCSRIMKDKTKYNRKKKHKKRSNDNE